MKTLQYYIDNSLLHFAFCIKLKSPQKKLAIVLVFQDLWNRNIIQLLSSSRPSPVINIFIVYLFIHLHIYMSVFIYILLASRHLIVVIIVVFVDTLERRKSLLLVDVELVDL